MTVSVAAVEAIEEQRAEQARPGHGPPDPPADRGAGDLEEPRGQQHRDADEPRMPRGLVDPQHRGRGIGRGLARQAVIDAVDLELRKLVVEVIADQTALIGMFRVLGFEAEALLADHVRDRSGEVRDLLVLANDVESQFAAMATAGVMDEL